MSRGGFKVNKTSYEYEKGDRVDWLDTFADEFAKSTEGKSAVEVARERNQQSIHDQVSSVFNNVPHTVESKVKEMQDRAGLTEYLKQAADESGTEGDVTVAIFAKFGPKMQQDILNFCKNRVSAHRGQTTVPAIQHDLLSTFKQHGLQAQDVNNEEVARCISSLIVDHMKMEPPTDTSSPELGLVDRQEEEEDDGVDFFKGIMPASG